MSGKFQEDVKNVAKRKMLIRLHIWGVVKNQGVVQGILRTTQNPTEVRRTQWVRRTSFDPSQNLFSWF